MSDRTPQNQDKFVIRLPDGMRDQIKYAAEMNNRSMNAEIVARLEASFDAASIPILSAASITEAAQAMQDMTEMLRNPEFRKILEVFSRSVNPDGRHLDVSPDQNRDDPDQV